MIKEDCIFCDRDQDMSSHYYVCDIDAPDYKFDPECKFCRHYLNENIVRYVIKRIWRRLSE